MSRIVLIADDERDIATVVAFAVRFVWTDAQVLLAGDGGQALAHFAARSPDLVILDLMMPPPDGFAVLERIRAVSQIPVLILSARDSQADRARAAALGATDYLVKPFSHDALIVRLRSLA